MSIPNDAQFNYPQLVINLHKMRHNVRFITSLCQKYGINVTGVIKGTNAITECVKVFEEEGCNRIASSRIEQLCDVKKAGIKKPLVLIRTPMLSEVKRVIETVDISLNSELSVLKSLNQEAHRQSKIHRVVLMVDLGDLREGFWDTEQLTSVAKAVEFEMTNLVLEGIGANLGCYGAILATREKLEELVAAAEKIEEAINRRLNTISGGATSSFIRVLRGDIPDRINSLRIGGALLNPRTLEVYHGCIVNELYKDVYTLNAEVIEANVKPTHPIGEISVDAFGQKPVYEDKGSRKRIILAIGKVDYGDYHDIAPIDEDIVILGCSSDHTIIDVHDSNNNYAPGDMVSFKINYSSMVFLTNSKSVKQVFID